MFHNRFTLADNLYKSFVNMVAALTNFHIYLMPLQAKDGAFHQRYNDRIFNLYQQAVQRQQQRNICHAETHHVWRCTANGVMNLAGNPEAFCYANDADDNNNSNSDSNYTD